jgi:hypothetical protein
MFNCVPVSTPEPNTNMRVNSVKCAVLGFSADLASADAHVTNDWRLWAERGRVPFDLEGELVPKGFLSGRAQSHFLLAACRT